jgi:HD superfamily phosphohydrolase
MLDNSPNLTKVVELLDGYLATTYPDYFGPQASHPAAKIKPFKIIHDNLWGTNGFSWRELLIIDSPLFQRLRNIHQTGLAYHVYPSARHSRFEHSLGVVNVASRVFDSLVESQPTLFDKLAERLDGGKPSSIFIQRLRSELRFAALLHDTGHSIHSHTSETVYSEIPLLDKAAKEITRIAGRKKGGRRGSFVLFFTNESR